MSDRCWMEVRCREADIDKFEVIGFEVNDSHDEVAYMVDAEANYGHYDDLQDIARAGTPFVGWHGAGGDYGPCRVASHGGEYREYNSTMDGAICATLRNDGSLVDLDMAREFLKFDAAAWAAIKPTPKADEAGGVGARTPDASEANAACPRCGGPAVRLFTTITCLKGCE